MGRDDNVVHYVAPSKHENGIIDGVTFRPREKDRIGPSVTWLEYFFGSKEEQVAQARSVIPLNMRPSGFLAELNVGKTTEAAKRHAQLGFEHTNGPDDHPSHFEIGGLRGAPPETYDLIAKSITDHHSAVLGKGRA